MSRIVVADAGPLIALARVGELRLLQELYGAVAVPPRVLSELRLAEDRRGSRALRTAVEMGWIETVEVSPGGVVPPAILDLGEAEAILLAEQRELRFLLIDERRGRQLARERGLRVVGTGGAVLAAKRRGSVRLVAPILDNLAQAGYFFSAELRREILRLAGEAE